MEAVQVRIVRLSVLAYSCLSFPSHGALDAAPVPCPPLDFGLDFLPDDFDFTEELEGDFRFSLFAESFVEATGERFAVAHAYFDTRCRDDLQLLQRLNTPWSVRSAYSSGQVWRGLKPVYMLDSQYDFYVTWHLPGNDIYAKLDTAGDVAD